MVTRAPEAERPTLEELFGAPPPGAAAQVVAVRALNTLAAADRVLCCSDLPAQVRNSALAHQRVLAELQAAANDDERLRRLLVERRVATAPGAKRLCRRLIDGLRGGS